MHKIFNVAIPSKAILVPTIPCIGAFFIFAVELEAEVGSCGRIRVQLGSQADIGGG